MVVKRKVAPRKKAPAKKAPAKKAAAKRSPVKRVVKRKASVKPDAELVAELAELGLEQLKKRMPPGRWEYALAYDQLGIQCDAYRAAYPKARLWTAGGVSVAAWKVHWSPHVQAVLRVLGKSRLARHQDAQGIMVNRLLGIVTARLDSVGEFDGERFVMRPYSTMSPEALGSLKKLKVTQEVVGKGDDARVLEHIEVEQHCPRAAAQTLMRLLGLDELKLKHSGSVALGRVEELSDEALAALVGE